MIVPARTATASAIVPAASIVWTVPPVSRRSGVLIVALLLYDGRDALDLDQHTGAVRRGDERRTRGEVRIGLEEPAVDRVECREVLDIAQVAVALQDARAGTAC